MRYAENIPEEFIVLLSPFIQNAFLKEKNLDAKDNLLLSLGKVGNYETIEFINKQVLNTKTDALLKERARYTIQEIVERLG